jgi:hypothetical protein
LTKQTVGLVIGGFLPALVYGLGGFMQKICSQNGIALGYYVISGGLGMVIVGLIVLAFSVDRQVSLGAVLLTIALGMCSATGMALVGIALVKYKISIAKLSPLYNMNTLVTVSLGLFLLSEWKEVHATKVFVGAAMITLGGILVANS